MARKRKPDDPLVALLATAPPRVLADLLIRLAAARSDVRRECFELFMSFHSRESIGRLDAQTTVKNS
jgi:hypothetical protein